MTTCKCPTCGAPAEYQMVSCGYDLRPVYTHTASALAHASSLVIKDSLITGASAEECSADTNPQESSSRLVDARDAARYRLLRDAKDTEGFWIAHGEYGRMSRWNGETADKAIDQAIAGRRGDGNG